ncbi:MAG: hypothetical protein EPO61_11260 [Nitrospirae bacterium]|nr:MAG: hypothetical protein EPO61_11260 [Nitrospirota bacterium]
MRRFRRTASPGRICQALREVWLIGIIVLLGSCVAPLPTMQQAAKQGDTKTVLLLLDQGADVNARTDREQVQGMTPLHWAAMYGQTDTVKALLARGADINARTGYSGETAIQLAVTPYRVVEGQAAAEREATVQALLDAGADVHNKTKAGGTLLCTAAYHLSPDIVGRILDKARDIEERDGRGQTPLWCAAGSPFDRTGNVRVLLAKGAKVNALDNQGKSVLAIAAQVGNAEVVRMLLAKGADASIKDQEGFTALDRAESNHQKDVVALLERAIAKQQPVIQSPSVPSVAAAPPAPAPPVSDVDHPPVNKATAKKHAYAVVIGIEQYQQQLPRADFAAHDAQIMGQYLNTTLGYAEEHVVVLLNDRATKNGVEKYIEGWLPDHVEAGDSVFIYFSGHGAPNARTGKAYLVPYDGDPAFVEQTGYPLDRLYDKLAALPAKEIVVMLDSCFSGAGGRSVIGKGMRPMVLSVENPLLAKGKVVVLAASGGGQVSSTYNQQSHGLLTYFFLKGFQGEADANHDGRIELRELYEYLKPQVERTARREFHNEQQPQLLGNPDILSQGIVLMGAGRP